MSDHPFLKCTCQNCGDSIEFPAQGVGLRIECPHCGQKTVLTGPAADESVTVPDAPIASPPPRPVPPPAPAPQAAPGTFKHMALVATLLVLGALAGSALWYFKLGPGSRRREAVSADGPSRPAPIPATGQASLTEPIRTADAPQIEKSIDDLKPGAVTLEKAKSGSLMYAVGTIRNDSPHQRFGVKVEIEFTDAKGRPAGKTRDYTQVIEPGREWRFRALVLDAEGGEREGDRDQ